MTRETDINTNLKMQYEEKQFLSCQILCKRKSWAKVISYTCFCNQTYENSKMTHFSQNGNAI